MLQPPGKSTKSRNSNLSIQIRIKPKSQFEFVLRDAKESEFLDTENFGDVSFLVENVLLEETVILIDSLAE